MSEFDIHVCLVSGQAAPNLLPLLDETMKPQKVLLLVTPEMKEKAGNLKAVIQPRGIQVEIYELNAADDFSAIQEMLLTILVENDDKKIALNATGGTKWMAMAAQEVFRANNLPIFYVDVATDKVLFLGSNAIPHHLSQRIDIENYLKVYGYQILDQESISLLPEWRELCDQLVINSVTWEMALGYLNKVASEAENKKTLKINLKDMGNQPVYLDALLRACCDAKVTKSSSLEMLEFTSTEARQFCNGGWLEIYVCRVLGELRGDGLLQDTPRLNMQVKGKSSPNEIDVAFMANNRLHIIECKTKRLAGSHTGQAGAETVYKLDSISELGGLGTRAMLVSYRKLRPADSQRAKDLNIKVVEGPQILTLKTTLRGWIKTS